jgi:uracil-DNA glycosylase
MQRDEASRALLKWHFDMGADECIERSPQDQRRLQIKKSFKKKEAAHAEESLTQEPLHFSSLEDLKKHILNLDTPLKLTAKNLVFGEGPLNPKVMIIGEAPGADEDLQGRPFVGLSGQLLERMFKAIGLQSAELYISNILPWRPPQNRTPSPDEIHLFLPYLHHHIALVNPQIIFLAGGVSAKAILDDNAGIGKLRGKWQLYKGLNDTKRNVIASFHPSFLIQSPLQKRLAWHDLLMLKQKL